MTIRVVMSGATGWVGKALIPAIVAEPDMHLAGAVARGAAGWDAGSAIGIAPVGVDVKATLAQALKAPSDVVVDYTKPGAVKEHALTAISAGRHVVIGTSGLGALDYAEIDAAAQAAGVGVVAAGNFSITATLMKRFALMAAKYVPDVEVIDYAGAKKPDAAIRHGA
jgi:4-hydroxy-tetrahydrodipicolinate reductase